MTTKLTLTIEKEVIHSAKQYARQKGSSLSELIENYLRTLETTDAPRNIVSPRVKRLRGKIRLPEDFEYKKELDAALREKHLK
ncbi:MAG TPA: DUF6364 family protein [Lacibacter sp.]|nr:DUF6364 family protein [Lacibacter sp.]HMO90013.1 DUF6364 family protein [Lacibacter sp.]HMP86961.1 DUF6364 family protein [Lacibacter sp.]